MTVPAATDEALSTVAQPERYIALRRSQVVASLLAEGARREAAGEPHGFEVARFETLCEILQAVLHFEFHDELETMKEWYAPFNPDSTSRQRGVHEAAALADAAARLGAALAHVLERGNYRALSIEDIRAQEATGSLIDLRLHVDFDEFEEVVVFARGESTEMLEKPRWWRRSPRKVAARVFDRVCIYVRFRSEGVAQKRATSFRVVPGTTILKLFRSIPVADLEMLFPNAQVRMRMRDKLSLGLPALLGGIPVMLKLGPALIGMGVLLGVTSASVAISSAWPMLMAFVVLGLFVFRQWDKVRSRRVLFLKVLSENLYFRNLDNNEGVLTRLIDEAEEEEAKEALLAYAFLLWSDEPLDAATLDARIEAWLHEQHQLVLDFEIDDALAKLERYGLVVSDEAQRLRACPLDEALVRLDRRWDGAFTHANVDAADAPQEAEAPEAGAREPALSS